MWQVIRPRLQGSMMLRVTTMEILKLTYWHPARDMKSVLTVSNTLPLSQQGRQVSPQTFQYMNYDFSFLIFSKKLGIILECNSWPSFLQLNKKIYSPIY